MPLIVEESARAAITRISFIFLLSCSHTALTSNSLVKTHPSPRYFDAFNVFSVN